MVDRGNFYFVMKVMNIQKVSAIMAIVVDMHHIISTTMADDGVKNSVKIPSFLISKRDRNIIKKSIHELQEDYVKNNNNKKENIKDEED